MAWSLKEVQRWPCSYLGHHTWQERRSCPLYTRRDSSPHPHGHLLTHASSRLVIQNCPGFERWGFITDQLEGKTKFQSFVGTTRKSLHAWGGLWGFSFPGPLTMYFGQWKRNCSITYLNTTLQKKQTKRTDKPKKLPVWRIWIQNQTVGHNVFRKQSDQEM